MEEIQCWQSMVKWNEYTGKIIYLQIIFTDCLYRIHWFFFFDFIKQMIISFLFHAS